MDYTTVSIDKKTKKDFLSEKINGDFETNDDFLTRLLLIYKQSKEEVDNV